MIIFPPEIISTTSIIALLKPVELTAPTIIPAVAMAIATLTAGEGIDVTNADGSITIASEVGTASNLGAVIVAAGEGMDASYSGGTVTVAGEDATTTNKGIASFSADNFTVSSGAVTVTAIDGGTF